MLVKMKLCLSLFGRAALRIKSWLFRGNFYMTVWQLKKTMIMKGQDIYSRQDEVATSPSSSESEEAKGEESSEEIDSQEERDLLMVRRLLGGQSCDLVNWIDAIKLHLYCCSIFFFFIPVFVCFRIPL